MRVKVIRQFLNGPRLVHEGEVIEVSDARARELEKNNLVVPQLGAGMLSRGTRAVDPTPSLPPGGPTGEDQPRSLSRRGRPPRMSRSDAERGASGF